MVAVKCGSFYTILLLCLLTIHFHGAICETTASVGGEDINTQSTGGEGITTTSEPVDFCVDNKCENQVKCINGVSNYTCNCTATGWEGWLCNQDVDECLSNPCVNGTCSQDMGSGDYNCSCDSGFTGENCDVDIKECSVGTTCSNGGYCQELPGSFKCHCDKNWTGSNCQQDVDECQTTCKGEGYNCTNTDGAYICECLPGHVENGLVCSEILTLPDKDDRKFYKSVNVLSDPIHLKERFPYFGKFYTYLFFSVNGYVSIGFNPAMIYPPRNISDWAASTKINIVAPYWWYNDVPDTDMAGLVVSLWSFSNDSDIAFLDKISEIIKKQTQNSMFAAKFIAMATWHKFSPYPSIPFVEGLAVKFQILLLTDGKQSYAIINYDKLWDPSPDRAPASFFTDSTDTIKQIITENYKRKILPLFDNQDSLDNADYECSLLLSSLNTKISDENTQLEDPKWCPCARYQVEIDMQFAMYETESNCFLQVLSYGNGEQQLCCYNANDSLIINVPGAGYLLSGNKEIRRLQNESRAICCGDNSKLCWEYYQVAPPTSCENYSPKAALTWGDPHFITLDGNEFTFNGWGEYILVDMEDGNFVIQIRTALVPVVDSEGTATQIEATVLKYKDNPVVEFVLKNSELEFYMDGMKQTDNQSEEFVSEVMSIRKDKDSYIAVFNNKISVKITQVVNSLMLTLIGDFNMTKGLLGFANGDKTDDFVLSNGTTLLHNSSEIELYDFGNSWIIPTEADSLFNYTGTNFTENKHADFTPVFYRDQVKNLTELFNNDTEKQQNAVDLCGETESCLIDYMATNNTQMANFTKMIDINFKQDKIKLLSYPPRFIDELMWNNFTEFGSTLSRIIQLNTPGDGNSYNLTVESNIDPNLWSFNEETNEFRLNTTAVKPGIYIKFIAEDQQGLKAVYQPILQFCFCQLQSQCLKSENNENTELACNCPYLWKGKHCEFKMDVCDMCFEKSLCNETIIENPCSCPTGLIGNGWHCYDKNECLSGENECDHTCINILNGYECSCNHGYKLEGKGKCTDINECLDSKMNNCSDSVEYCVNSPGGFSCMCRSMYKRSEAKCIKVAAIYGGSIVFASVPGTPQQWSPKLEDPYSVQFKDLASLVQTAIKKVLEKKDIGLIQASVVKFFQHEKSARRKRDVGDVSNIEAEYETSFDEPVSNEDLQKAMDSGYTTCTESEICSFETLIGVNKSRTSISDSYDLCQTENNNCQKLSTTCQSANGTFQCNCREGFNKWNEFSHACQDIDECMASKDNNTVLRALCGDQGMKCFNVPGSYYCDCTAEYSWNTDTKCTLTDYCKSEPCRNGASCINALGDNNYACKCKYGWRGQNCQVEDSEATKQQTIIIAVSASLGALCLILLVILCCLCVKKSRKHSSHHSINMEEYSSFKGIPRAQLRGQDNPMMENESNGVRQSHAI